MTCLINDRLPVTVDSKTHSLRRHFAILLGMVLYPEKSLQKDFLYISYSSFLIFGHKQKKLKTINEMAICPNFTIFMFSSIHILNQTQNSNPKSEGVGG